MAKQIIAWLDSHGVLHECEEDANRADERNAIIEHFHEVYYSDMRSDDIVDWFLEHYIAKNED